MPIVFDEVVGSVDSSATPNSSEQQPAQEAQRNEARAEELPPIVIQALWKRLEQRVFRLMAD